MPDEPETTELPAVNDCGPATRDPTVNEEIGQLAAINDRAPSVADERSHEEAQNIALDGQRVTLEGQRYDLAAKKSYGTRIFWLVAIWIGLVLAVVVWSGYADAKV